LSGGKRKPANNVVFLGVKVFSEDLSVVWAGNDLGLDLAYTQILTTLPNFGKIFFGQVKVTEGPIKV